MGNMGYCRFRNTLLDLQDCKHALDEPDPDDELQGEELEAKEALIELCQRIVDDHAEE